MIASKQSAAEAPVLSIIIPSINTRAHLERMLRSLGAHDFPRHLQTIVVDVGSADGTLVGKTTSRGALRGHPLRQSAGEPLKIRNRHANRSESPAA